MYFENIYDGGHIIHIILMSKNQTQAKTFQLTTKIILKQPKLNLFLHDRIYYKYKSL